jgi:hypothetical protein
MASTQDACEDVLRLLMWLDSNGDKYAVKKTIVFFTQYCYSSVIHTFHLCTVYDVLTD